MGTPRAPNPRLPSTVPASTRSAGNRKRIIPLPPRRRFRRPRSALESDSPRLRESAASAQGFVITRLSQIFPAGLENSAELALALLLLPATSNATRTFEVESTTPDTLVDFNFTADMTIAGDFLTIVLTNDSMNHVNGASPSLNPNDLLSSFYFSILGSPTLSYTGAFGNVCLPDQGAADDCSVVDKEADLRAFIAGDDTWQFKDSLALSFGSETLTYGIGTAGNNSLSPNGFNGNVVDGIDYSIYAGDITTQNLDGKLLVLGDITFTFSGLTGFSEDDIGDEVLFGLGTQPDSTAFVPEPGTGLLLGMGVALLGWSRRRARPPRTDP